jgi:hypothetical protein
LRHPIEQLKSWFSSQSVLDSVFGKLEKKHPHTRLVKMEFDDFKKRFQTAEYTQFSTAGWTRYTGVVRRLTDDKSAEPWVEGGSLNGYVITNSKGEQVRYPLLETV